MTTTQKFARLVSTTYQFSPSDVKAALLAYAGTCGVPKGEAEVEVSEESASATVTVKALSETMDEGARR